VNTDYGWRNGGRLASATVKSLADSVFQAKKRLPYLGICFGACRGAIATRDKHLGLVQEVLSQYAPREPVEVIVLDGLLSSHGTRNEVDYLIVFTSSDYHWPYRRRLSRLGGHYADAKLMALLRPLARKATSPVAAEWPMITDNGEAIVVSYFDGKQWYIRPWFHVSHAMTREDQKAYVPVAKLASLVSAAFGVDFGPEGQWSTLASIDDAEEKVLGRQTMLRYYERSLENMTWWKKRIKVKGQDKKRREEGPRNGEPRF
jgi:hypothetical protein